MEPEDGVEGSLREVIHSSTDPTVNRAVRREVERTHEVALIVVEERDRTAEPRGARRRIADGLERGLVEGGLEIDVERVREDVSSVRHSAPIRRVEHIRTGL